MEESEAELELLMPFQWSLQVESQFKMGGKVYAVGMSPIAATHMLIAAGTEDPRVRLCDIASGAFTHTLTGHRGTHRFLLFGAGHVRGVSYSVELLKMDGRKSMQTK